MVASIFVCLILFYFRTGIFSSLSYLSQNFFRPVLVSGNSIGNSFLGIGAYFTSKNSLNTENTNLKLRLDEAEARMANYNSILTENTSLKETLERKDEKTKMILSAILAKPNQSAYDTLIIDLGVNQGLKIGETVFAFGNVPIGRVAILYPNSSKVILFSSSGEKTQGVISGRGVFMELVGRGGGNFEMIIPRDLTLVKGDEVALPGITPHVLGIVEKVISDPRDPFIKALLVAPVNIQELKFVQVETRN